MEEKRKKQPVALYVLAVAASIALDQWLKAWVVANIPLNASSADKIPLLPGIVHLTYIQNRGAAFGSLQDARWLFLLLLVLFAAVVVWALAKNKLDNAGERWMAVLALGGALGNGYDRLVNGYVVDMFEVEFMDFAIFNVADCFVVVSCIVFILIMLLTPTKKK